ncbi:MAG: hypothetical protein Q9162_004366 [Coniocarpon cinnabarinum]
MAAFIILFLAALFQALRAFAEPLTVDAYTVSDTFSDLLSQSQAQNHSLYTYPTDLTRNLVPKALHSHNDYWRDVPFWSALSVGAISVEADVWLYNSTLYVGHEASALTPQRTFQSLYIHPILSVLQRQNPSSDFVTSPTRNGVFDTTSDQTLYLWVDSKTEGASTFEAVVRELQPLRDGGWLTAVDEDGTVQPGPVTVIGTGNTPLNQVQGIQPRDYFYDARLDLLNSSQSNITASVSPIASVDFETAIGTVPRSGTLLANQTATLQNQVEIARAKGIGARYWDTPGWPISVRNSVWGQLWDAGVMLINVDDLVAGAGFGDGGNYWTT